MNKTGTGSVTVAKHRDTDFKYISYYALIFIVFLAVGTIFFRGFDFSVSSDVNAHISKHFSEPFFDCQSFYMYFSDTLFYCLPALAVLAAIMVAGFTAFCISLCSFVVAVHGFSVGFCVLYLADAVNSGVIAFSGFKFGFVLYLARCALITAACIYASMVSVRFSKRLRRYIRQGNADAGTIGVGLMSYAFKFVFLSGVLLVISFLYCSLLYSVAV